VENSLTYNCGSALFHGLDVQPKIDSRLYGYRIYNRLKLYAGWTASLSQNGGACRSLFDDSRSLAHEFIARFDSVALSMGVLVRRCRDMAFDFYSGSVTAAKNFFADKIGTNALCDSASSIGRLLSTKSVWHIPLGFRRYTRDWIVFNGKRMGGALRGFYSYFMAMANVVYNPGAIRTRYQSDIFFLFGLGRGGFASLAEQGFVGDCIFNNRNFLAGEQFLDSDRTEDEYISSGNSDNISLSDGDKLGIRSIQSSYSKKLGADTSLCSLGLADDSAQVRSMGDSVYDACVYKLVKNEARSACAKFVGNFVHFSMAGDFSISEHYGGSVRNLGDTEDKE